MQLNLLDALHRPPVAIEVERDSPVVQGDPDFVFFLPHKRLAWHHAEIEIHRHEKTGLWMWSASWNCDNSGRGYRVGEKWGRFAESREDALFHAVEEIKAGLDRRGEDSPTAALIRAWAAGLQFGKEGKRQ